MFLRLCQQLDAILQTYINPELAEFKKAYEAFKLRLLKCPPLDHCAVHELFEFLRSQAKSLCRDHLISEVGQWCLTYAGETTFENYKPIELRVPYWPNWCSEENLQYYIIAAQTGQLSQVIKDAILQDVPRLFPGGDNHWSEVDFEALCGKFSQYAGLTSDLARVLLGFMTQSKSSILSNNIYQLIEKVQACSGFALMPAAEAIQVFFNRIDANTVEAFYRVPLYLNVRVSTEAASGYQKLHQGAFGCDNVFDEWQPVCSDQGLATEEFISMTSSVSLKGDGQHIDVQPNISLVLYSEKAYQLFHALCTTSDFLQPLAQREIASPVRFMSPPQTPVAQRILNFTFVHSPARREAATLPSSGGVIQAEPDGDADICASSASSSPR